MNSCIFCKIVNKVIPARKIRYEDEDVMAFDSVDPKAKLHILIIPKKHILNFLEINNNFDFSKMIKAAQKIVLENKIKSGYKLIFNGGKYQEIPHLHWHLLAGDLKDI